MKHLKSRELGLPQTQSEMLKGQAVLIAPIPKIAYALIFICTTPCKTALC